MAGQDQSANLSGMLTGISETMGGFGDAYKPVLQAAMKPRGDMNDPAHLEALAQWASSNGDAQAAQMYMTQARQLRSEQKEQSTMRHMAATDKASMHGNVTAQQMAQAGDVNNLDRSIAALQERLEGDFPSIQARNYAAQNLERLKSMRAGALSQQTKNHAAAVLNIDKVIAQGTNQTANDALLARKDELLTDPEVQKAVTAQELATFQAQKAQQEMENEAFLQKNMPALREAVNDPKAAQEIIASAPASAQLAVQSAYNSMRQFQKGIDEVQDAFDVVAQPSDMEMIKGKVDAIPEELRAGATEAMEALREAESFRDSNGQPLTEGHAIRINKARTALTSALVAAQNSIGQQEYAARRAEERRDEDEIAELEIKRDVFRPDDVAVNRRAQILAEEAGDYVTIGKDKRGKGGRTVLNTGAYTKDAKAQLRAEYTADINKQIALRTGEEVPAEEAPEVEGWTNPKGNTITQATVERGLQKVGKKAFVKRMRDEGYTDEQISEMIGGSPFDSDDLVQVDPYRAGGRVSEYARKPNTLHGVKVRPASEIYG